MLYSRISPEDLFRFVESHCLDCPKNELIIQDDDTAQPLTVVDVYVFNGRMYICTTTEKKEQT